MSEMVLTTQSGPSTLGQTAAEKNSAKQSLGTMSARG
jgi:hypothetical protein